MWRVGEGTIPGVLALLRPAQSMVGGTSGGISAHGISCGADSSQGASMDCVVGVGVSDI